MSKRDWEGLWVSSLTCRDQSFESENSQSEPPHFAVGTSSYSTQTKHPAMTPGYICRILKSSPQSHPVTDSWSMMERCSFESSARTLNASSHAWRRTGASPTAKV